MDEDDMLPMSQQSTGRKRKRLHPQEEQKSQADQEHEFYGQELLDYFMLSLDRETGNTNLNVSPPSPPPNFQVDRPIDDLGHTALHWAAAVGDVNVVKDLIARGANMAAINQENQTPFMRAVLFTNNHERESMPRLVSILQPTIAMTDFFGGTVFHHIAHTTNMRSRLSCARYYCDRICDKLSETLSSHEISQLLNMQDHAGDTALHVCARNGARKLVRALIGRQAASDIPNHDGQTADELIRQLHAATKGRIPQASSPPYHPINDYDETDDNRNTISFTRNSYRSEAATSLTARFAPMLIESSEKLASAYDSELKYKETDLSEAKQQLARMEADRAAIQQQIALLQAEIPDDDTELNALEEEVTSLSRENESLIEVSQHTDLHRLVRRKEDKVPDSRRQAPETESQETLQEKVVLSWELYHEQERRKELVKEIVKSEAVAGTSDVVGSYQRLIALAMGIREEDVEALLPELLEAMEGGRDAEGDGDAPVDGDVGGPPRTPVNGGMMGVLV